MSEEERTRLLEFSADISAAMNNPWQPRCIAEAFARPEANALTLTMQRWIDLERLRSPLLVGVLPQSLDDLAQAAEIFGLSIEDLGAEEAMHVARALLKTVSAAFDLSLPMNPPEASQSKPADGFGSWAPLFAFLVVQCGIDPDAALALRVDRAYVLVASHRRNQGWQVAGTPYAMRECAGAAEVAQESEPSTAEAPE